VGGTTRLSPYLHFGCVSPLETERRVRDPELVRQLAWRDFFHQLLCARPETARADLRVRAEPWTGDAAALDAWKDGRTGYPIVDAAMRQLRREGWLPNRARLIAGSFLAKHLDVDWRAGADHFEALLVDGDVACNRGNWQWVAGTGADRRPGRILSPVRQARRHDPDGEYVRRYVPELAAVDGPSIHEPWKLDVGYPAPIVDHDEAVRRFRAGRVR
jgi:deoxyribodipyrimidine photo-lyase